MRHELITEIEIDADAATVWRHLTDLDSHAEWNPFITRAAGTVAMGERLALHLQPQGGRAMRIRPTVTVIEQERVLEWLGRLMLPGVFDGRHRFELVPTERGTTLIHREQFSGLLVRPLRRMLDGPTRSGFAAMNEALAQRARADRVPDVQSSGNRAGS